MICPNCKKEELRPWIYKIGCGIEVKTNHCNNCQFNVTDPAELKKKFRKMRERMAKKIKIVSVGEGIGLRFPKEFSKFYPLKKGKKVLIKPDEDGLKIVL